jgi:hypothetical protein
MTAMRLLMLFSLGMFGLNAFAFTSIATIKGESFKAWYRVSNYDSQKEADAAALEGCRTEARSSGIGKSASKCKVITRAKGPGYGAVVCGDNGCAWGTGHESAQVAVDSAYSSCAESYKSCQSENIPYWEDFAGFARKPSAKVGDGYCRPRSTHLRCQSTCTNGDCIVSYENGCKMRVQVSPRFDSFQNQWTYPSPQC